MIEENNFLRKLQLVKLFSIKAKHSKKFDYYNENMHTNSYFQMHLSRWGKRFRGYRKNQKCFSLHDLSEYIIFHMIVTEWPGPLKVHSVLYVQGEHK